MKKILFAAFTISIFLFSCTKDKDDGYVYSFVDQDLQGKIGGTAWNFVAGNADDAYGSEGEWSVHLYPEKPDTPCDWVWDVNYIMFNIPKKVGIYELNLSFTGDAVSHTATLYADDEDMNYVATQGAIEIISINDTASTITGRMDIRANSNNQVNGDFTITYCQD